ISPALGNGEDGRHSGSFYRGREEGCLQKGRNGAAGLDTDFPLGLDAMTMTDVPSGRRYPTSFMDRKILASGGERLIIVCSKANGLSRHEADSSRITNLQPVRQG